MAATEESPARVARAVANEIESWADGLRAGDFESTHDLDKTEARQAMLLLHFLVGRAIATTKNVR